MTSAERFARLKGLPRGLFVEIGRQVGVPREITGLSRYTDGDYDSALQSIEAEPDRIAEFEAFVEQHAPLPAPEPPSAGELAVQAERRDQRLREIYPESYRQGSMR